MSMQTETAQPSNSSSLSTQFELASLYYARCDFQIAIQKLEDLSKAYYSARNFDQYLKCQNMLLRMYAERLETEKVNSTKERLQDLVLKEGFELNSKTYYTLGVCSSLKNQHDSALDYFQKSLAIALAADAKEDMCYAIAGLAVTYSELEKYSEALKEIYNLQVFFEVLDLPDVKLSTQILNGIVLRRLERYDQALEVLWSTFESLKVQKNLFMYIHLLYATGVTYLKMGEIDMARLYLQLAKRSADPENLKNLVRDLEKRLKELGVRPHDEYDLIFDLTHKAVIERKRGRIDFHNQFILLDLLHLFIRTPGQIYSKEALAQKIWGQDYDPSVHDNKIYVTIKRLRKMIEPDYDKPRYIFRAKNGYYLNRNARILVEQ